MLGKLIGAALGLALSVALVCAWIGVAPAMVFVFACVLVPLCGIIGGWVENGI